jgi:hypothetical protein
MLTMSGQPNRADVSGFGNPRSTAVQPMRIPPKPGSGNQQSQIPTLCQVIAMTMCYKRLAFVVLFLPCVCVMSPIVWNLVFTIINWISGGFGLICIVMTTIFSMVWYSALKQIAPSPEKLQKAYAKSKVWLPLAMFVLACILVHVVSRLTHANKLRQSSFLQWAPTFSWGIGMRPAFGFLLMGAAMLLRFVGQGSYGKLEWLSWAPCHGSPNSHFAHS